MEIRLTESKRSGDPAPHYALRTTHYALRPCRPGLADFLT
jgi:hypothetical protein